jgi:paraquat-inducible protein B
MDSQFNTLTRSYHDNFLQYRLTGTMSYKQAYTHAKTDIERVLKELEDKQYKTQKEISDFYGQDVEGNIRNSQSQKEQAQRKLVSGNDQLVSAEMRMPSSLQAQVSNPSMTNYYIALGVMTGIYALL